MKCRKTNQGGLGSPRPATTMWDWYVPGASGSVLEDPLLHLKQSTQLKDDITARTPPQLCKSTRIDPVSLGKLPRIRSKQPYEFLPPIRSERDGDHSAVGLRFDRIQVSEQKLDV